MREGGNVRGLKTAATHWGSAAVGACSGADLIPEAVLGSIFVLAANTLLRPVVNRINREPIDTHDVEVTNTVYVIASREGQKEAMRLLEEHLELAHLPTRDLEVHPSGDSDVEIATVLLSTSIDGDELDRLVERSLEAACVSQAFWSPSTTE